MRPRRSCRPVPLLAAQGRHRPGDRPPRTTSRSSSRSPIRPQRAAGGRARSSFSSSSSSPRTAARTRPRRSRQAPRSFPIASSEAEAANRAAVTQVASQVAFGTSGLDIQELAQESIVVQVAAATSVSNGGIGGRATVVNCAVTQQSAAQAIGAVAVRAGRGGGSDHLLLPGRAVPDVVARDGRPPTAASDGRGGLPACRCAGGDCRPDGRGDGRGRADHLPRRSRGTPAGPHAATRGAPGRVTPSIARRCRPQPGRLHRTSFRPCTPRKRASTRARGATQEPETPARSRRSCRRGPAHVGLRARSCSGRRGSTGIAAILLAFALMPPLMLRTREASAVRRPTDVSHRSTSRFDLSPRQPDPPGPGSTGECSFGCDERM